MKLSHIIAALEEYAPLSLQEKWDNSGLQVGLPRESDGECTGALLCLDVTPDIISEAVRRGCNLVVSHHPLIFKGLKSLIGRTVAERTVAEAIRAGVAVYSSHTALDSTMGGISYTMATMLGATVQRVLAPGENRSVLLRATCPRDMAADVRLILLGSRTECNYVDVEGESSVSPDSPDFPHDIVRHTPLCRVETIVDADEVRHFRASVATMPCGDKVSVETVAVDDGNNSYGLGVFATYDKAITLGELVERMRSAFALKSLKASRAYNPDTNVTRIALCGGAGGEFIGRAAAAGAQAYISGDIRYHDFADNAFSPMTIFDIGHFESELCAKDIFLKLIQKKFPNFAVYFAESEQNPVINL